MAKGYTQKELVGSGPRRVLYYATKFFMVRPVYAD